MRLVTSAPLDLSWNHGPVTGEGNEREADCDCFRLVPVTGAGVVP
jgi:hypothetical protein